MTRHSYIKTWHPKLFCPECNTHLRISNLERKLVCGQCNEYIPEEKLTEGFIKNIK